MARFGNFIVGSLLFVVLNSGLNMIGFSIPMMQLIEGIVFLIFVAIFADRKAIHVIK
jgi:ribose transport system permease protein